MRETLAKEPTKKQQKKDEKQEALTRLREMLKPGDRVHGIVRQVSRSGMSRQIDFFLLGDDGPLCLSWHIATALEYGRAPSGALKVGGCGMNMILAVVLNLSYALYPLGFGCIGEGCPSNDHSNGDRDRKPHNWPGMDGYDPTNDVHEHWHSGDYALRYGQL